MADTRDGAGSYFLGGVYDGVYVDASPFGACRESVAYTAYQSDEFPDLGRQLSGFVCDANSSGVSEDLEEPFVDALLWTLEQRADERTTMLVTVRDTSYGCGVLYFPDGTYLVGGPLASGECGP